MASSTLAQQGPEDERKGSRSSPLRTFLKFTRPHTVRGTILGATAGCARALVESRVRIDWSLLPTALLGVLALICGNIFIVGVNQIYDVEIDRVNKPFLPMAAGELSSKMASILVWTSCVMGMVLTRRFFSPFIFGLYTFGLVIGALYSLPPFRLRRFPVLAALTISCARGFLLNFGVYHATKAALKVPFSWSPPITFLAVFMTVFATVIALAKDLPDIEGDRKFKVSTFASRLGPKRMMKVVTTVLALNYGYAMVFALAAPSGAIRRPVMALGHLALLTWLLISRRMYNPAVREEVKGFYGFIWKLFYAEYLLFPFI